MVYVAGTRSPEFPNSHRFHSEHFLVVAYFLGSCPGIQFDYVIYEIAAKFNFKTDMFEILFGLISCCVPSFKTCNFSIYIFFFLIYKVHSFSKVLLFFFLWYSIFVLYALSINTFVRYMFYDDFNIFWD